MEDFDFSHLLNETPPPENGPARVRRTVARRRKRNRVVGASVAVLAVLGIGGGLVYNANNDSKEVLLQSPAGQTVSTLPTTTTNPDPVHRYVGISHTSNGSGLPVNTQILAKGGHFVSDPKRGDVAYYWVRDDQTDMIWMDNVTAFDTRTQVVTSSVVAVFPVDPVADQEFICLGTCFNYETAQPETNVIAVFRESKVQRAWTVNVDALTLTPSNRTDLSTVPPEGNETPTTSAVTYPDPKRPALYGVVAQCRSDACPWYDTNEQIQVNGGGGPEASLFANVLYDRKENKNVLVWLDGNMVRDTLVVDANLGALLPPSAGHTYKGQPVNNLVYTGTSAAPTKAWLMDIKTHKFTEVNVSDVAEQK